MNELFEEIKKSPLVILGGAVVVVLSALITISTSIGLLHNYYQETLGHKPNVLKKISRLAAGTNISYFRGLLGEPVFINYLLAVAGEQEKSKSHGASRFEYIFVNESFFVQAVTTSEGEVTAYSVTTRTQRFNPKPILGWSHDEVTVQLGRTRFTQLDALGNPESLTYSLGARRFHYGEIYYLGNPGKYQTYVFSLNDAGDYSLPNTGIDFLMERLDFDDARLKAFRMDAVINTYTIVAPNVGVEDLGSVGFGPDLDQVRTLTE